ncbi:MAG: DUF4143 domain-containing protein [Acidobacteria bacterium]|nr:DUF4143 domain-containing protein [Acidobacteriota bacterium]
MTGSVRLDVFRRGSDSLLGRFLPFRLHPLTLAEVLGRPASTPEQFEAYRSRPGIAPKGAAEALSLLDRFGPFPEPLARQHTRFANLWRRSRQEMLIRQDLRELTRLPELGDVELLAALLPERAGSLLSRGSLRQDLSVAHSTIARWLRHLEAIYLFYEIKPDSQKIQRSLRKEGKAYLWDFAAVPDPGARFENLVANHLLKAAEYWEDSGQGRFELGYIRNKDGRELDFVLVRDRKPWLVVETKLSDATLSKSWSTFLGSLPAGVQAVQLVGSPGMNRRHGDIRILSAADFLAHLP